MTSPAAPPGAWPRFMRAKTAAAYVDEVSVEAFLRKVGTEYPAPIAGVGRSRKWDKDHLDRYPTRTGPGRALSLADDL